MELFNVYCQISGWTHAMPDLIISHLFGKVQILFVWLFT